MENTLLIAILSGAAFASFVSGIFSVILWHLNNRKKKDDGTEDIRTGVQVLMYDRIKFLGLKHIDRDEIAAEDLEDLQRMHRVYHDNLKGNGYLDAIMQRVKDLPIKH